MIKPQQIIEIGLIAATLSVMLGESVVATSSQLYSWVGFRASTQHYGSNRGD
ncbi:hypothetical protein H6G58_07960 [Arthrospira platensis FACHB-971]|uniref:hypothetical protein n=1 Tax=Limnospira TaxID=2596745 RepID=UPI0001D0F164|nr:hypothetical protein [Arthrospira platensis FACHB-971]MDF2210240.1 hypothetical protein [Arthrospira platensis NCB002]MDT9185943.1 hypothetical protein [Limnospira sp. PMC 289.06]BAI89864.1 hypothetical protein NIES39_D04460 [Arthrospira platensis NIES-39]BDT12200.1 hypothetical protein N39L_19230 [Arthrospira platensis NIES-39]